MLAFSYRPLKLEEIYEMLEITAGLPTLDEGRRLTDPEDVFSICGSHLNYQRDTDVVGLVHHSVKTYLTSDLRQEVNEFQLSEINAHHTLATKCLAYLSLDAFSSRALQPVSKLGERFKQNPLF